MFAWAEIEAINRSTRSVETIRVCNADIPANVQWDGKAWAAAMHSAGSIGVKLFDGSFGNGGGATSGRITLVGEHLSRSYPTWAALRWQGAKIRLYAGINATSPALRFSGRVSRSEVKDGVVTLTNGIDSDIFEKDVLSLSYAGTGGAEGPEDIKGNPKPWLLGYCRNAEPVLIDVIDNVYQFSAYGPIKSVVKLYERGADFGASVGNYASYAALVAATIPEGRWATCLASGLVRLGAPQYGVITGDVEGDFTGAVFRRKTGLILRHIAATIGVPAGNINTASFDGIDTYAGTLPDGGNVNIYITSQTKFSNLAKGMALGLNAHAIINPVGAMSIVRPVIGTPTIFLDGDGRRSPEVTACIEGDTETPFKRISMGGNTCWRVHDTNEIATEYYLVDKGDWSATGSYREGNIVNMPNGSRWIYIADEAGNTAQPGTNVLVWEELSAASEAYILANDAIDQLAGLADDGILSINEKTTKLIPEQARLEVKWGVLSAQAGTLAVSTVAAATKRTAWNNMLNALTPAWNSTSAASPVVRATYDTARNEYDAALYSLDQAIKAAVKTIADAGVTGAAAAQTTANTGVTNAATAQATANAAATAAATAQAAADAAAGVAGAALAAIEAAASDGVLTPVEKPSIILDRDSILAEQTGIEASATTYGVTTKKTAYTNAISALTTYLAALTTPVLWSNLSGNTTIVGTTFRQKFFDVYVAKQDLLNTIADAAKILADAAQTTANTAVTNAAAAQTSANTAQSTANTANAALADIASDSLLTPDEKPRVILDRDAILAEQAGIEASATAYGITTEKTAYTAAITALTTYLATLTAPVLWSNLTGNTTIVGATFRSKFGDVYAAKQALLNKVADAARGLAAAAQAAADTGIAAAATAQATADGKIDSFYQNSAPTMASEGDLWFDTDDGNKQYRRTGSSWVLVQDAAVGLAITAAAGAQATADGKVTTYVGESAPSTPSLGDLWFRTSTGYLSRWSGSAWASVSNIGATAAQITQISQALTDASNAQATADGKIETYYQSATPSGATIGDLWFKSDESNRLYRHNGTTFVATDDTRIASAVTAAAGAQATADGKVTTFVSETSPTAGAVGDLWFKTSTGELRRWSGSAWGSPLVDLTAASVPYLEPSSRTVTANADYLGNVPSAIFPLTASVKRFRGNVDTTASAVWSIVDVIPSGAITATISGGNVTISAVSQSGSFKARSVRDGVTLDCLISVNKVLAPPPNTGGSSGSGTTVSDTSFAAFGTSTSYGAISDLMTVKTGAVGRIDFSAALELWPAVTSLIGQTACAFKWRHRPVGGSWTDMSEVISDPHPEVYEEGDGFYAGYPGYLNSTLNVTGLSASTDYEVQLFARRSSLASRNITAFGNAVAVGS